jgi:hypothetical protein
MRNSLFIVLIGAIMMVIGASIFVSLLNSKNEQHISHSRVEYLKDSLEMEYYKKQLESYSYDHSEIKDTTVIK